MVGILKNSSSQSFRKKSKKAFVSEKTELPHSCNPKTFPPPFSTACSDECW